MAAIARAPTREYQTAVMDSHRWDDFQPRDDDIIIATYPKCGTTWTQRIVDLLVFQSPQPRPIHMESPWLDATFFAPVEDNLATLAAQRHRRFVKTHLPFDAVPLYETVKYIHVARDGRDACFSMHNHMRAMRPEVLARMGEQAARDSRIRSRPQEITPDARAWFLQWIDAAEEEQTEVVGIDLPFCEFETTYWRERRRPNVLLVHYNDLTADLAGEMDRIADFLDIEIPESVAAELVGAARFASMKAQGAALMPGMEHAFDGGSQRFLHKGTNGRWKGVLTDEDIARYEALVRRKLTVASAAWLEHGRLIAGDPRRLAD